MTIKPGDPIPDATLYRMTSDGPAQISTGTLFGEGKTVLFAVPGAFTPTCAEKHLPGFLAQNAALRAKGVDRIVCVGVNDVFVMDAWGKDQKVGDQIDMVADGNGGFTDKMGLVWDMTSHGLGKRSRRYAAVISDGVLQDIAVEEGAGVDVSSAEKLLGKL